MSQEKTDTRSEDSPSKPRAKHDQKSSQTREERLKSALKANMSKRKLQARARSVDSKENNSSE